MGPGAVPDRVIVLYNDSHQLIKGEPEDMLAEKGVVACAAAIAGALSSSVPVVEVPIHGDVEIALAPYPPNHWTVFNLGEGVEGRLFEVARIAWALEAMGYRFTGSDGDAIAHTTHKAYTKKRLLQARIATPRWWILRDLEEVEGKYPFPLIVKPVAEDGSLGIGPEAVVHDLDALRKRVIYVVDRYRQAALVEKFIYGREFNISIWGDPPEVLPLYEIDFSDFSDPRAQIVSFAAKWEADTFEYNHTPGICPAVVSPALGACITKTALNVWQALGCQGYARVDLRVDENEIPYVIEVNCNPDLSPEAGFYQAARTAGFSYAEMALKILKMAYPA